MNASLAVLRSDDATYRRFGSWVSDPTGGYQARWRFEEDWSGLGYEKLEMVDQAGAPLTSTRWVPAGPTPWAVEANQVRWSDREPTALVDYPHFKGRLDLLELRPTDPPALDDPPDQSLGGRLQGPPVPHPRFSTHFTAAFYLDEGNDFAPFGSDEGADIFAGWLDRPGALTSTSTVRTVLAPDTSNVDELIGSLGGNETDLDAIIIGAAFTLLRLTGQIDDEGRQLAIDAAQRTHRFYSNTESQQMLDDLRTFHT